MSDVKAVRVGPQLTAGTWANVYFMHVYGELTEAVLRDAHELHVALIREHPRGTGVMVIAEPNTPIPGGEVRDLSSRLMRELASDVRACATVIAGGGFWVSAVRSFLSAIYFVAKQPCPTKALATVEDAAEWLGPRAGQIPSQLVGAAREVMSLSPIVTRSVSDSWGGNGPRGV